MIRLQQYEKLLKTLLRSSSVVASFDAGRPPDIAWPNESEGSTLGKLVKKFLEEVVARDVESSIGSGGGDDTKPQRISIAADFKIVMEPDRRASVESGLRELVEVRNELVHSFIDQFDIWSVEGCLAAADSLKRTFELIDAKFLELRDYAESHDRARVTYGEFIQSQTFRDIFDGISSDSTVHWPTAGIVAALREAAEQLGGARWTPLDEAVAWVVERHPEQTPERYGCRTWPQVVHESKVFTLKREPDQSGKRVRYYGDS